MAARDKHLEAAEVLVDDRGAALGVFAPVVLRVLDDAAVAGRVWLLLLGRLLVAPRVGLVVYVVHDERVEFLGVLLGAAAKNVALRLLSPVGALGMDVVEELLSGVSKKYIV